MNANGITEAELNTLRTIARNAEEVDSYRVAVAREDVVGTGDLTHKVTRLMEASLRLDGMVAIAEESGLFTRAGGDVRRMVLSGRAPREEDLDYGGVPVYYVGH